jgi:hypothetical protein
VQSPSAPVRRLALETLTQIIGRFGGPLHSRVVATLVVCGMRGLGIWIVMKIIVVVGMLVVTCIRVSSMLVTSTFRVVGVSVRHSGDGRYVVVTARWWGWDQMAQSDIGK